MKRSLLSQMRNEWRSNIWMIVELTMVSLIVWFLFCSLWPLFNMAMKDKGYDVEDLYVADIHAVDRSSAFYNPYDSMHNELTDLELLLTHLRSNPNVEIVGVGRNIRTYNYNYYSQKLCLDSMEYHGNVRTVTPEVIRVYRLTSRDGKTTEELAGVIERGEIIVSESDYGKESGNKAEHFLGKEVYVNSDSANIKRVGALSYGLRRTDYEPSDGVIYLPLGKGDMPYEVIIRIVHGRDREFKESLTAQDKRVGNVFLSEIKSLSQMREIAHLDINMLIRSFLICSAFLLIVVFLGFLGTFWFRTQERVDEIAVRMVNGASRRDIMRRFFGEGMLLLCIATLIATPLELLMVYFGLFTDMMISYGGVSLKSVEIYESMGVTLILLMILVVAGIWFPARKAMNVNPAEALKDQ